MELIDKEIVELKYMSYLGFKYIARNEIGTVEFFKSKPVRDKIVNGSLSGGYDTWVIGQYPITDFTMYGRPKIGKYNFITWNNGVWDIERILNPVLELDELDNDDCYCEDYEELLINGKDHGMCYACGRIFKIE